MNRVVMSGVVGAVQVITGISISVESSVKNADKSDPVTFHSNKKRLYDR